MAMRDSSEPLDDCSSFCGSEYTHSSSSTVWGPGALTGKFLKAFGEKGLDLVVSVRIRIRLASIKQTLEKHPKVFIDPQTPGEWQQLQEIYDDLKELCRDYYSLSLGRTAANIIREIFLTTRPSPGKQASPMHHMWRALLVRLQRAGGVLSVPPETVITVGPQESEPSHGATSQESPHSVDPRKRIEIGVKIETTHSYELASGFFKRRLPFIHRGNFGHRRKRKLDDHKWRRDLDASLLLLSEPVGTETSHDNEPTNNFSRSHSDTCTKTQHSAHLRHMSKPTSEHPLVNDLGFDPECLSKTNGHTLEKPIVEDTPSHLSPDTHSMLQFTNPVLSRHCRRMTSDIQHDLDQARKLIQDLENELLHSIQQMTLREQV